MFDAFLQDIVQINFIPICIIIFLIVFLAFNDAYEHELTAYFMPVLAMLFGLIITDNADYYAFSTNPSGMLRVITAILGYNLRIFIMASLIGIAFRNSVRKILKIILFVPAVVNLLITSMALFSDLFISYADDGSIIRGPFSFTPHIVLMIYALFMYVYSVHIWLRHDRRCESVVIIMTVTLAILGTICELVFRLKGILIGVIAMDVTFYYLCIHIEYFKFDSLTDALNRTSFYADLKRIKEGNKVGIMSIDLNDLKKINDTEGHAGGDNAIKTIAHNVRMALDTRSKLYRIGGDEFEVICMDMSEDEVKMCVDRIKANMRQSKYTFAIGYAIWDGKEPIKDCLARADERMYTNKRELKG